jgi:hypothetical protein
MIDVSKFITPHTEQWKEARKERLTSSEIDKIFVSGRAANELIGQGGISYINKVIGQILTGIVKETRETDAMLWGLTEEADAKIRYSEITNIELEESFFIAYNEILGGTNDGWSKEFGTLKSIAEVKCPDTEKFIKVLRCKSVEELKKVDAQYFHQPQANMLFCEAEFCDFICYDSRVKYTDLQMKIIRIYPDMRWVKEFKERMDWIADYINETLEQALKTPELNAMFRIEKKIAEIDKLKDALDHVKAIAN